MQRTLFSNFYQIISAEKHPQRIRIRLGNHIFLAGNTKISIYRIFQLAKLPFLKLTSAMEAGRYFDQMKVSRKKMHKAENA